MFGDAGNEVIVSFSPASHCDTRVTILNSKSSSQRVAESLGLFTITVYHSRVLHRLTVQSPSHNTPSKHANGMGQVENGPYTGGTGDMDYGNFKMYEMYTVGKKTAPMFVHLERLAWREIMTKTQSLKK